MESDLQEFISSSFHSIWSLELLAFLQVHADRAWSAQELVRELRGSDLVVAQSLAVLGAAGLIRAEGDGVVRYGPASENIGALARETVRLYREKPGTVRRAILSPRDSKLHIFADAFKFTKG